MKIVFVLSIDPIAQPRQTKKKGSRSTLEARHIAIHCSASNEITQLFRPIIIQSCCRKWFRNLTQPKIAFCAVNYSRTPDSRRLPPSNNGHISSAAVGDISYQLVRVFKFLTTSSRVVITSEDNPEPILSKPAIIPRTLYEVNTRVDPIFIDKIERPQYITIHRNDSRFAEAFCFHTYCWQFLKKSESCATPVVIDRYARSMKPLYVLPADSQSNIDSATLSLGLDRLALTLRWSRDSARGQVQSSDDTLRALLRRIWTRLPVEIQSMVWEYLGVCATRSILAIASDSLGQLLCRVDPSVDIRTGISNLESITVHLVSIYGVRYLCGFDDGKQLLGYIGETKSQPCKIPRDILAVHFTIGPYGIRRVRFQGRDGLTAWIGDEVEDSEKSIWTGIMRMRETRHLRLFWDVSIRLGILYSDITAN